MSDYLKNLRPVDEDLSRNLPVPVEFQRGQGNNGWESEPEDNPAVPLSHYIYLMRRNAWKIVAASVACVIATVIVSARLTPLYESTATVDIDRESPPGIVGQEAARSVNNDADQFLATQIHLIESDSVLRPVVQEFKLARLEPEQAKNPRAESGPTVLKRMKVSRPPNTYLLLISYRSQNPQLAADVANAIARSYLEHSYKIRINASESLSTFMEKELDSLKAKMERSGAAQAAFEKELNIINPEEKTNIVSNQLLQLNTEYTAAQTDRVRKEAAYQSVKDGSFASVQISSQGDSMKKLQDRYEEAQQKFAEVKAHYGTVHPEYRKAAGQVSELERQLESTRSNIAQRIQIEYEQAISRETMLRKAVQDSKAEFDHINARSFEYRNLKREAEADKKLYEELITKIKEAGINAGFQNSSIRIADWARPALRQVSPNVPMNVLLAFMVSILFAVGAVIVTDMLDNTIRDPEQVVKLLNTDVIGNLPLVSSWRDRNAVLISSGSDNDKALVPQDQAMSSFVESIRTLRNSILLTDFERRLRSIVVTSAAPGEGKSTVTAHLALAHAQQGQRTLLIDADLRRPTIHSRVGIPVGEGLSNVLLGERNWHDVVSKIPELPELDILTAGPTSRRAADLIGKGLFMIMEEATREYDLVILDSPPLLGFSEPLQLASYADGVLVVALAGKTNRKAVGMVLSILRRLHANVLGLVLNEVTKEISNSYYYYGHAGKYAHYYTPNKDI